VKQLAAGPTSLKTTGTTPSRWTTPGRGSRLLPVLVAGTRLLIRRVCWTGAGLTRPPGHGAAAPCIQTSVPRRSLS